MGRWSRDELEDAFDRYQVAAHKGASTGDWKDWVECFTPDATYLECQDGNFWGREAILKWITDLMSPWPAREMTAFPIAWYTIDEDKGWIISEVRNRMNDLGDGRIYEETNMTTLHYAGNGLFSCEIDVYNPRNFGLMFRDWVKARLERAEPEEREQLAGELQAFMKSRAAVDRNGPGSGPMKFGIRIPPPQMGPISDPDWIVRYAQLVESLGFESLWTIDHALMCVDYDSTYPYKTTGRTPIPAEADMPDPLILMMWIAAATQTIRMGTSMLILPQRNPLILAKQVATLDRYAGGRITLGVGVGWVKEEVEILKQDFHDRGRRADEWIEILRTLWQDGLSAYQGEYFQFENIASSPKPVQPGGVPLMIGGHSEAAARRAGRCGDEFYPHWSTRGPDDEELSRLWPLVMESAEKAGRDRDAVSLTLTSTSDAKTSFATAEHCKELGADRVVVLPPKGELDGALPDELARFREQVIDPLG